MSTGYRWHSIRLRIALLTALVSAVTMASAFLVIDRRVAEDAREQLRRSAIADLAAAVTIYEATGKVRLGASVDPDLGPDPLREADLTEMTSYYDGRTMWVAHRVAGDGPTLTLAVPGEPIDRQRRSLRSAFLLAGLVALGLTAALAAAAGQSLSRRLRRAAATATRIADGGSDRIRDDRGRDEVAALSRALDTMADSLTARVAAEAAFSADVAHELRTPMTALVSAAELLPPDDEASRLVGNQVARLRRLVDDLLEISRLESGQDPTDLAPYRIDELVPEGDGGSTALVLADPRRVERIVANLVDNARKHAGTEPRVVLSGTSVTVEDDGPGFSADLLEHGPRRFHRESKQPGSGLGLTICDRQAAAMGARLVLANGPGGGGRATLELSPAP
ncbi:sensor histidine kinase [Pimelobacter simplex]|uniref:sensor histidine kinase n=1 Tax=Nocardioides simplex TaxID=2045 RepID=UPI003AAA6486